ncbi:MAG TPA: hypothetical protein VGS11_09845 [Candidatus Bathyarchaeia archaeon]|nr:hypothetical protein [Candidatus Bathyarchaeia archaeon]
MSLKLLASPDNPCSTSVFENIEFRYYLVSKFSTLETFLIFPYLSTGVLKKKMVNDKTIKIASVLLLLSVSALAVMALGVRATLACVPVSTSRGPLTTAAMD